MENQHLTNSGIYLFTVLAGNSVKFYVGKSSNLRKRSQEHFKTLRKNNHRNCLMQRAWNKYGEVAFTFSIIENCDKSSLVRREQILLDEYRHLYGDENILNIMKECVETRLGVRHNARTRQILRDRQLSNWADPVYREAMVIKFKASRGTAEARKKQSEKQKEVQNRPDIKERKRQLAIQQGLDPIVKNRRLVTNAIPSIREKRRASAIAAKSLPGVREQASITQKIVQNRQSVKDRIAATMATPESKARRRAAATNSQSSPEYRHKQRRIQLISQNKPETKAKRAASMKAYFLSVKNIRETPSNVN